MSDLLLVAASGLAREVLSVIRGDGRHHDVRFIDDNPRSWGSSVDGVPVVGALEEVHTFPDHQVLVCAGRGAARRALVARLDALGVPEQRYAHVVHPSVDIPNSCTVGRGSIVLAHACLTSNVQLGRHVVVMPNVTMTHDDLIEDFATLCAGVSLGGNVRIRSGAYLGMNSSVRESLQVGTDATLGMGAALVHDLPARQAWVGVPARPTSRYIMEVS